MRHFYLSFADPTLPTGKQWLGAAIVPAHTMAEAVMVAHALGCNPGGEVLGHPVKDPDTGVDVFVPDQFTETLLTHEDLKALSNWAIGPRRRGGPL